MIKENARKFYVDVSLAFNKVPFLYSNINSLRWYTIKVIDKDGYDVYLESQTYIPSYDSPLL